MSPEEAFKNTEEKTKEVLEYYQRYKLRELQKIFKDQPLTFHYETTNKYMDYDAIYYVNGERKLNVEVKVREYVTLGKYPYTKLPLRKHAVAKYYYDTANVKSIYIALFADALAVLLLHEAPDKVECMIARHDRGNEQDEYALYDIKRFNIIG
jgi:hypothetical protein